MALHETLMRIRSQPPSSGLSAVLLRVIQPLLSDLDWTVSDPTEVGLDHDSVDVVLSVPRGEHASFADRGASRPAVYIKVVDSTRELSARAESVVAAAARDGVDLCALTTGKAWQLYVPKPMQSPDSCRYAEWDLQTDPTEHLADELELYLGRDALAAQRAQRSAEHALTTRLDAERVAAAIPNVWRRLLAEPDSFLVEYVQDEVRKETGLQPAADQVGAVLRGDVLTSSATALPKLPAEEASLHPAADQVGAALHEDALIPTASTTPELPPAPPRPPRMRATSIRAAAAEYLTSHAPVPVHIGDILAHLETRGRAPTGQSPRASLNTTLYRMAKSGEIDAVGGGFWRATRARPGLKIPASMRSSRRPARRLTGYRLWGTVHETTTWKGLVSGVASEIYQRHPDEFHQALSLRGHMRQYVSTNADDMRTPVAIPGSPYVIETHFGGPQATKFAHQMLTLFGHETDDLEILYDR